MIDIYTPGHPHNYRWDKDKNAKICNIVFLGGTYGNFLKFFIEKFSNLTPDIPIEKSFNDIGTFDMSKQNVKYSGKIQRYHAEFINDNIDEIGLNVCQILPTEDSSYLYLVAAMQYRGGNFKYLHDTLYKTKVKEQQEFYLKYVDNIKKTYNIDNIEEIPKFLVRDWLKLSFLGKIENNVIYKNFKSFSEHDFFKKQNTFQFPFESFFSFDFFLENLKKLDNFFNLCIDWNRLSEMRDLFNKLLEIDIIRKEFIETLKLCKQIDKKEISDIPKFLVVFEAYIYAHIEKSSIDKILPLTNYFFKNTKEIYDFLKYLPNWYKIKNPNIN